MEKLPVGKGWKEYNGDKGGCPIDNLLPPGMFCSLPGWKQEDDEYRRQESQRIIQKNMKANLTEGTIIIVQHAHNQYSIIYKGYDTGFVNALTLYPLDESSLTNSFVELYVASLYFIFIS